VDQCRRSVSDREVSWQIITEAVCIAACIKEHHDLPSPQITDGLQQRCSWHDWPAAVAAYNNELLSTRLSENVRHWKKTDQTAGMEKRKERRCTTVFHRVLSYLKFCCLVRYFPVLVFRFPFSHSPWCWISLYLSLCMSLFPLHVTLKAKNADWLYTGVGKLHILPIINNLYSPKYMVDNKNNDEYN